MAIVGGVYSNWHQIKAPAILFQLAKLCIEFEIMHGLEVI
jgi:hypothetical protein